MARDSSLEVRSLSRLTSRLFLVLSPERKPMNSSLVVLLSKDGKDVLKVGSFAWQNSYPLIKEDGTLFIFEACNETPILRIAAGHWHSFYFTRHDVEVNL